MPSIRMVLLPAFHLEHISRRDLSSNEVIRSSISRIRTMNASKCACCSPSARRSLLYRVEAISHPEAT
jgi:hypothetical protein